MALYDKILEEDPWYVFNPASNSLEGELADKAKFIFFKNDVKLLERIERGEALKGIDVEKEKKRGARSSVIPFDHDIQLSLGPLIRKYPHVLDPIFLLTLVQEGHFQGLAINPNSLKSHKNRLDEFPDVTIIAKINDASRMVDPKYVAPRFATIDDALDVGAKFTGWSYFFNPNPKIYMRNTEELSKFIAESKAEKLLPDVWAYPNGPSVAGHPYLGKESAPMVLNAAKHALNAGAFGVKVFYPDDTPNIEKEILEREKDMMKKGKYQRPLTKAEVELLKGFANTGLTGEQCLAILCKRIANGHPIYTAGGAAEKGGVGELARATKRAGATGNFVGRKIFCHSTPAEYFRAVHEYWSAIDNFYPGRTKISELLGKNEKEFLKRIGEAMHYKG